jgi:hypothetical protein
MNGGGGEVHIHTHDTACLSLLFPLPLLFLVRSPLSLLFPFLSHLSALTIQFMTMNAGELLANSLSSGNVLCRPLSVLRPSRPSASPSPSHSPSEFPTIPILILPLFHSQIRLRVKMPLKNWSRHPGRTMCVERFYSSFRRTHPHPVSISPPFVDSCPPAHTARIHAHARLRAHQ